MDVVGFVKIKSDATTHMGVGNAQDFIGDNCRVIEFGHDGGVLVLNRKATAIATFDKEDILSQFECGFVYGPQNVVTPPGLDMIQQMAYVTTVMSRKGGYNNLLCQMVIEASLHKGEFNDHLLWAKQ